MQAYATAERVLKQAELRVLPSFPGPRPADDASALGTMVVDELLDLLADRLADRLAAKMSAGEQEQDRWLDTRSAAGYLGVHLDTIRRLAAEGMIPVQQAGAGCKLYFRRSDLDRWRSGRGAFVRPVASTSERTRR